MIIIIQIHFFFLIINYARFPAYRSKTRMLVIEVRPSFSTASAIARKNTAHTLRSPEKNKLETKGEMAAQNEVKSIAFAFSVSFERK